MSRVPTHVHFGNNMKRAGIGLLVCALIAQSALAQDVPFAEPPPSRPGDAGSLSMPGLGDIMVITQLRHIKLWYAGRARNWDLVKYELAQISESLRKAALLYTNIPIEYVAGMSQPLQDMRAAASAEDEAKFSHAFASFTNGCNKCHVSGGVGFIRIQTPISSPFSDEVSAIKP
jgi:hypothetical protein